MLLDSGMDILLSLESIKKEVRSKRLKRIIEGLKEDIDDGFPVWRALENAQLLSGYIISLVKIGEQSGKLPDNLKIISAQQQKNKNFHAKIKSAMMYPLLVLSLATIVGIGIAWFILPKLSVMFKQLKVELPLATKILLSIGNFMGDYGLIAAPLFLLSLSVIIYFIFLFPKTKFIGQAILFRLPGSKEMIKEVELARFGYLMGTLFEAGIPIVNSIDSLADVTSFYAHKKFYFFLRNNIREGNSFQKSFEAYPKSKKLIPLYVQHMIVAGEKSGRLPETFLKIGEMFEEKTENTTKNFTVILEPVLLIIVWLGVVSIALAIILPIYSLVGGLNSGSNSSPPPAKEKVISVPTPEEEQSGDLEDNSNELNEESEMNVAEENSQEEIEAEIKTEIRVLPTGLGYLNVRDLSSTKGVIVGEIYPDEVFEYINEENGWFEVIVEDETTGWVSGKYVEKVENNPTNEESVEETEEIEEGEEGGETEEEMDEEAEAEINILE